MSVRIVFDGPASALRLGRGDRYEIAASEHTDARRIVRRDFDGDPTSLSFDPGADTALVLRMGGRDVPINSPYIRQILEARRVETHTGRRR